MARGFCQLADGKNGEQQAGDPVSDQKEAKREKRDFWARVIRAKSHKKLQSLHLLPRAELGPAAVHQVHPSALPSAFPPALDLLPSEKQGLQYSPAQWRVKGKILPNSLIPLIYPKAQTEPRRLLCQESSRD